jgi:large subunit ribosomal protein L9
MEVILLEKIENLGGIGERVKVRAGYGRNFLVPQGKATLATAENIAAFEVRRSELEAKEAGALTQAQSRAEKVRELKLFLRAKAGTEGKLFGSIGTADIAEAAESAGVPLERSEVRLHEGPIRALGEHEVEIHLHSDVSVPITVTVEAEE